MIHSMRLVLRPELGADYVKQMDLDTNKNIVVVRLKNSAVLVIQLIARKDFCTIIEKIQFRNQTDPSDQITAFRWLARMKCYAEGTSKGYVKIRDIEKQGECMLILPTQFIERVQSIHYSSDKNILFIGSRDGKFKAWKVPTEWRQTWVDKIEQDYQIKLRSSERASIL